MMLVIYLYRTLPKTIISSMVLVTGFFLLVNISYSALLTKEEILQSNSVAVIFGDKLMGSMKWCMSAYVACSAIGSLNGEVFSRARLIFAAARMGHVPRMFAAVQTRFKTPMMGLILNCMLATMFLLPESSNFDQLLAYLSFSTWLFNGLSIFALLVLRVREPELPRPFKVWIIAPILGTAGCLFLVLVTFARNPIETILACTFILLGIPLHHCFVANDMTPKWLQNFMESVMLILQKHLGVAPEYVEAKEMKDSDAGPDNLSDFEKLFGESNKSLLAITLTKDIWEEYKDEKDAFGVSFKTCIYSGVVHSDSTVGAYAGSHDSYKRFHKLFDRIIQDYHGHGVDDFHQFGLDPSKLITSSWIERHASMIISTRVRVARNLAGYPLSPGMTKEHRLEVLQKVAVVCKDMPDDLQGTLHPLEGMDETTKHKLVKDHLLFKEGDRFLEACNSNADWPTGRGIFFNEAKTLIVWVNEEDHLRLISMQEGADINQVYSRLARAVTHFQSMLEFSYDDHLGYITTCPTNLGTALRASVHVKLSKMLRDEGKLQSIAGKYTVQIRGSDGEHSKNTHGICDISNSRRLGRSENELLQDMMDGVEALLKAEKNIE